jgi:hypothetical protein
MSEDLRQTRSIHRAVSSTTFWDMMDCLPPFLITGEDSGDSQTDEGIRACQQV